MDLHIEFDEFLQLYRYATAKPYSFLYIDVNRGVFRRTFKYELTMNKYPIKN